MFQSTNQVIVTEVIYIWFVVDKNLVIVKPESTAGQIYLYYDFSEQNLIMEIQHSILNCFRIARILPLKDYLTTSNTVDIIRKTI